MSNDRKTIRMNPELIKKVEQMAKEQNRSFSNMVVTILKISLTRTELK